MTERTSDPGRWVDGDLESGADEPSRSAEQPGGPEQGDRQPADPDGSAGAGAGTTAETGVGLTMGEPNSFEPEEDAG